MDSGNRFLVTVGAAVLFAFVLFSLFAGFGPDAVEPDTDGQRGDFQTTFWGDYAWAAIVIGVIIFAGAAGVLALVGGEMKWR
jgi:hypothetical protein